MKIITYIYIFALYILFTPGFLRKTKLNIQTYLIYSLLFAFIMYLTFDLINQKNVESYNKYDVDVKGVNSLVDLIKTQFGGSSGEKKIDIHNQIAGSNGNSNINCWNALGKNQKELEIIKVQLDSFAGTKTDIDKLNNQLNTLKQEVDGLDDKLIGSAGTDKEVDGLNLQIKNYQGEIDKLEQQIKLYNETDEDIKKINNQISKLQSEITGLNLKITDCTNINGEKTGTIDTLNATINGQNTTITSLQSRINSREGCWQLLFTSSGYDSDFKNIWSSWYNSGGSVTSGDGKRSEYDKLALRKIRIRDSDGNDTIWNLQQPYLGQTILSIVSNALPNKENSRNDGNSPLKWKNGHATIGTLIPNTGGKSGVSDLRIGVGDGSYDPLDWALFMPVSGNGRGDMKGTNCYNLGGEERVTNANVTTISLYGML